MMKKKKNSGKRRPFFVSGLILSLSVSFSPPFSLRIQSPSKQNKKNSSTHPLVPLDVLSRRRGDQRPHRVVLARRRRVAREDVQRVEHSFILLLLLLLLVLDPPVFVDCGVFMFKRQGESREREKERGEKRVSFVFFFFSSPPKTIGKKNCSSSSKH